jgi:uncharacterized protein (DUF362 family)/Pyruvate/2-oxoacid:ferredoxin oxidoreductase delta subunit
MAARDLGVEVREPVLSVVACEVYDLDIVRQAVSAALAPLGGIRRFVQPGMRVLLKPNLLKAADWDRGIATHPSVMQVVAELVQEAGGTVWIGDSPSGPVERNPQVMHRCGAIAVAEAVGAQVVPFDGVTWKRVRGGDYFVAPPVLEADVVIDMPKLKTHVQTRYTGAVKNLFGVISGMRKRELHLRAPGIDEFSQVLVDVLELVQPELTILDGVLGIHGNGPGMGGVPHSYKCIAASTDPVALDAVLARAMGYRTGEIIHLSHADRRGLGVSDPEAVRVVGDRGVLDFGKLDLPRARWYFRAPGWVGPWLKRLARVRPQLDVSACVGCGRCTEVCPKNVITPGHPPSFDLQGCIGCLCCAEICPQGAIEPRRNLVAQLVEAL